MMDSQQRFLGPRRMVPVMNSSSAAYNRGISDASIAARDRAASKLVYWVEQIIILYLLLQFSSALIPLLLTDPYDIESDSSLARNLWLPAYAFVMLVSFRYLPKMVRMAVFSPILVVCVLWCGISFFWSIEPSITMRRSFALLITTVFGIFLAARYDWNELIQRLAFVFLIGAVVSLFLGAFMPVYGQMQEIHYGAWRGAWLEKNSFGLNMAKGLLLMMCAFAMQPKRGWIWVPGGLLCFALVLLSTSKAALLAALVAISGFFVIRVFRRFPFLRIPLMYGVVLSISTLTFLMIFMPDAMFELIGKDRTLTGRTDIWDALILAIQDKPLLGYGYGAFWNNPLGPSYWTRFSLEWGVPTAHNGWIETWLSAGLVAVVLFAILYICTLFLALDRLYRGGVENYWVILSTVVFLMVSLSESMVLQRNDLSWVMFVATSAKLFAFEPGYWRDKPIRPYFQPPEPKGENIKAADAN